MTATLRNMAFAVLVCVATTGQTQVLQLDFPGNAELTAQTIEPLASYDLPTGPWSPSTGAPTLRIEGEVTRQAWRIAAPGITTLQILSPLRQQLRREGFDVVLDCDAALCGGFDFRFGIEVLPPPAMVVDLGEYRFLSALRSTEEAAVSEGLSLLVSTTGDSGYVQMTRAGPAFPTGQEMVRSTAPAVLPPAGSSPVVPEPEALTELPSASLADRLETDGHVILSDLTFEIGSAQLGPGPFPSLDALAAYLGSRPNRRIALVGHTDASGALEANIALSKRRAASVVERLVTEYGLPRTQIEAEGMGYLAPVASNLSEAGREANRRVEAVVISTE